MIDIGVASPSAHGQAMMSTATALISAKAMVGSGPQMAQTTKVTTRASHHRGHEEGSHHVRELLDRRAAALGFGTIWTI